MRFVVEHKTSGQDITPGGPYWQRLRLESQVSTYVCASKADGVLYDVIRKPALKPYQATPIESRKYTKEGKLYATQREYDETLDEYKKRLRDELCANPDKYFQRATIVRLASEEREAAFDLWQIGQQIAESRRSNMWPRNTDACETYGHPCEYWSVCTGVVSIDNDEHFETKESTITGKKLPVLSNSASKAYRSCNRKYFFGYELRRRPLKTSHALRFGTMFHLGLEHWWKTLDILEALEKMKGDEFEEWDRVRAEEMLIAYDARWRDEALSVLGVEEEFAIPLVNPETCKPSRTWMLGGRFDAIVEVQENADTNSTSSSAAA